MHSEATSPSGEPAVTQAGSDRRLDFHPGMEMRWEITRSTADTAGESFEATNWLGPKMGGPPVHVHPTAEESYQVIEGALDICVDGQWRTLQFESFFREMQSLIEQGKIKRLPPKEPRSAIYVAMLFGKYPNEIRVVKPPSALSKALARLGRALGFKLES